MAPVLTDDCLLRILSYLDDQSSFLSFALTCQRFQQVTKTTRSVLHTKLLRSKAEYFVKRYIVEMGDDYDKYCQLRDFLRDSAQLTGTKRLLTFGKIIDVWQRSGPVVAKLFTWLRNQESSREEGEPRATCYTEYGKFTLDLPSSGKRMVVKTSHFGDYGHNYDRVLKIHVTCGDLDVKSERFTTYCPEDYMYWGEDEVKRAVGPMKEVIALLQKELGETVPPITDHSFIWLCYFFPEASNLDVEHKLSFKDATRNAKPTPSSVQSALDEFHKSREFENSLRKLISKWETDKRQESKYPRILAESVRLLAKRSEKETLDRLGRDADRFYNLSNDYDFRELPKKVLLDLILRTSLEASSYDAGSIADKYVESRVSYRCYGGKTMKVFSSMHGDGASYPTWHEIQLKVTLPDGKVLKLEAENKPLEVEKLSPVTELVKEGIIQRMGGECIPKISNLFTAAYFLQALEFDVGFLGQYHKLIPSESVEESSEEELEDSEP